MTFAFVGGVTAQKRGGTAITTAKSGQAYFTDVKTLATYFSNGNIPEDFPKTDLALSENDNVKAVVAWTDISANYALLSELGKTKLNEYKATLPKADKVVPTKR